MRDDLTTEVARATTNTLRGVRGWLVNRVEWLYQWLIRGHERELRALADRERQRSLLILDSITDGFVTVTRDLSITFANRRAEQILGVPREVMIGGHGLALFPRARNSSIHKMLAHAFQSNAPVEIEDYYAPTDRWFEIRVFPSEHEYSVYFRDVTARRKALESIEFQTRLLDAIGQAVIATDLDGTIVYWNRVAENLLGWSSDEMVGETRIGATLADHSELEQRRLGERLRLGQSWQGEAQMLTRSGSTLTAAIADAPLTNEEGTLLGMVRIVTDLTARKSIEEEQRFLAEASAALAATLDTESTIRTVARFALPVLADGCLLDLVDEDGAVRRLEVSHVNERKEEIAREIMRRYPAEPAVSHPVIHVIRTGKPQLLSRVSDPVLRAIALDDRHLGLLRDLTVRSAVIVPLIAHGRMLGALTLLSSESDREYTPADLRAVGELGNRAAVAIENARLYEAAVVASRAKSDFLAVMSHELRTPLTTVMGYTDLLLAGVPRPLDDKAYVYIDRIRTAAWHLLGIIEQILIYARIEGGREQMHPQRVNVSDLVRDAAALIEPVAEEKGLSFHVGVPPDVVVETDPTKLRQILLNLLSNAVKFTEQGQVTLEAQADTRQVRFVVNDTGIGIAEEHLQKVFDPFWQVDQSSTRHVGGTGLGLSVARRLVRLLGGEITVESSAGEGARFTVDVPMRWGAMRGTPAAIVHAESSRGN